MTADTTASIQLDASYVPFTIIYRRILTAHPEKPANLGCTIFFGQGCTSSYARSLGLRRKAPLQRIPTKSHPNATRASRRSPLKSWSTSTTPSSISALPLQAYLPQRLDSRARTGLQRRGRLEKYTAHRLQVARPTRASALTLTISKSPRLTPVSSHRPRRYRPAALSYLHQHYPASGARPYTILLQNGYSRPPPSGTRSTSTRAVSK